MSILPLHLQLGLATLVTATTVRIHLIGLALLMRLVRDPKRAPGVAAILASRRMEMS